MLKMPPHQLLDQTIMALRTGGAMGPDVPCIARDLLIAARHDIHTLLGIIKELESNLNAATRRTVMDVWPGTEVPDIQKRYMTPMSGDVFSD